MGARHVTENCEQPVGESQVTSSEQMVIATITIPVMIIETVMIILDLHIFL